MPLLRSLAAAAVLVGALRPARADDKPAYRVLAHDKGHVAIVDAEGQGRVGGTRASTTVHDIALLPNGNVLHALARPPSSR